MKTKTVAKIDTSELVNIKPLEISTIKIKIIGLTPFLPEPMDLDMIERYDKKKSGQTYDKDTLSAEEKAKKKHYYTMDGKEGIPARGFYKAMIRASSYLFEKSEGGMRIIREGVTIYDEILPLKFKKQTLLKQWGRASGMTGAPVKIVRNAFHDWSCDLTIHYNKAQLTPEQIMNVLNWAGFYIGIGAFRKENTGSYGAFKVEV